MYMSSIWCSESEYMSNMEDSKYMSIMLVSNYVYEQYKYMVW